MLEQDAPDDTLLQRAEGGAERVARHLSQCLSAGAGSEEPELKAALGAIAELREILSKESRS